MGKTHAAYPPEFRRQMVEMVRAGRDPEDLAREFEPSGQAIRNWVRQAERDEGRRSDGVTTSERDELTRLRRENKQLRHPSAGSPAQQDILALHSFKRYVGTGVP